MISAGASCRFDVAQHQYLKAAGRITAAQLQAARLPSAAVAAGDQATIEAAARGDLDEAQRAAEL